MVRAPELYTPLSIFDVMTRSDDEAILARNTCDFYGGKYCNIVGSLHSTQHIAAPMACCIRPYNSIRMLIVPSDPIEPYVSIVPSDRSNIRITFYSII
jgi:hypothetical protein